MTAKFIGACVLCGVLAFALAGCATSRPEGPAAHGTASEAAYAATFTLAGRISVRAGERIDSGSVRWSRQADSETIGFYSPLGSQVAELRRSAAGVSLIRGEDRHESGSIAELTQALFGVSIDLDLLARLVQGVGLPATRLLAGDGREWSLQVEQFHAAGPHRFARRVNLESGDIRIKLVIDEWQAL